LFFARTAIAWCRIPSSGAHPAPGLPGAAIDDAALAAPPALRLNPRGSVDLPRDRELAPGTYATIDPDGSFQPTGTGSGERVRAWAWTADDGPSLTDALDSSVRAHLVPTSRSARS